MSRLHFRHSSPRSGSALITALILCIAVGTVIAFILRTSNVESRLNEFHFVSLSARNASESVVDYGVGQLIKRWANQVSFRDDELAPYRTPLTIEDELKDFLSASNVTIDSLTLVGGTVPAERPVLHQS